MTPIKQKIGIIIEHYRIYCVMKNSKDVAQKVFDAINNDEAKEALNNVNINVQPNRTPLPNNIMVFQRFAMLAATKLKPSSNRILMYFFALSEYENQIAISQEQLQEDLILGKSTVVRALNELKKEGIILSVPHANDKRFNEYILNPMSSWKGNGTSRKILLEKISKLNPNQLDLFGETFETTKLEEDKEIRERKRSSRVQQSLK